MVSHGPESRPPASPRERVLREQTAIDALDKEIISLVEQRQRHCRAVRRQRETEPRSRTDLARENAVVAAYHAHLGETGTTMALALLQACRHCT
ncbi:chorismate mutase [Streptomyces sp. NPDC050610]|uniref:chorismate mutase n=1 Tax=Streptomyces sp. NPDC050610 TaxID=3157097 RepID=UPI00343CED10